MPLQHEKGLRTRTEVVLSCSFAVVSHVRRHAKRQRAASMPRTAVIRDGQVLPLPSPSRVIEVEDDKRGVTLHRLTREHELEVFLVQRLFQPSDLQRLVSICVAREGFRRSLQRDYGSGEFMVDSSRTSESCPMLWPLLCPPEKLEDLRRAGQAASAEAVEDELQAVLQVVDRCSQVIGVESSCIEPLQLVRYAPGQYYRPHMDTHEEPARSSSFCGEQRTHTLLVFISDIPEEDGGGYLHFPNLGLRVLPKAGDAVLWRNLRSGANTALWEPDPQALHEGEAPVSSQKIVMNVWVADRPLTTEAIQAWRQGQQQQDTSSQDQTTSSTSWLD
eukprot:TRINITY_DN82367_c0_g1_i1.p1 TRINITY_DN82367_c0_g1~~TRINITY_DN82367_c0_g1_i1.p1  ORF type:complete len:364 (-),score=52.25 TRINITY_DN82367_c0_g1_i1:41-1036(-)